MTSTNVLFSLLALVLSAGLAYGLRPLARVVGLVDRPDGVLKDHTESTPITGGLAIVAGLGAGWALAEVFDGAAFGLVLGLLVLGTYDDLRPLGPVIRLAAVTILGALLTFTPSAPEEVVAWVLIVMLVVVTVNAVNLLDGADGVAGTAGMGAALGLAALAWSRGVDWTPALIAAGAIGGFLVVNWPRAKTFLGDGGAYAVGGLLAFTVLLAQDGTIPFYETWLPRFVVACAMLGVFLVDLLLTLQRRRAGRSALMAGDRLHSYDQLRDRGWSPGAVALAVGGAQILIVSVLVVLDRVLEPWPAAIASVTVLAGALLALGSAGFAGEE